MIYVYRVSVKNRCSSEFIGTMYDDLDVVTQPHYTNLEPANPHLSSVLQDVSTNTDGAGAEFVSKSTISFLTSSIPHLRTQVEEVNVDRLNQLVQFQKEVSSSNRSITFLIPIESQDVENNEE